MSVPARQWIVFIVGIASIILAGCAAMHDLLFLFAIMFGCTLAAIFLLVTDLLFPRSQK